MDIAFYQLTVTPLERALPKLLEKVYNSGMRALVLCESAERMETLNSVLWTFSPGVFLPHGSQGDPKRHPIWLTMQPQNVNDATILVVTNGEAISSQTFVKEAYVKCIDIFDGNDQQKTQSARERYQEYQSRKSHLTFWKQDSSGTWQKGI